MMKNENEMRIFEKVKEYTMIDYDFSVFSDNHVSCHRKDGWSIDRDEIEFFEKNDVMCEFVNNTEHLFGVLEIKRELS